MSTSRSRAPDHAAYRYDPLAVEEPENPVGGQMDMPKADQGRPATTSRELNVGGFGKLCFGGSKEDRGEIDYYQRCEGLPRWAYTDEVAELARRFSDKNEPVPLGMTVGPAVRLGIMGVGLQVIYFALFMPCAVQVGRCSADGYAETPWWWMTAFAPFCALCLSIEFYCCRFFMVPKVQVTGNFALALPVVRVKIPPIIWLAEVGCISLMNLTNTANIGNFTAMLQRAQGCYGNAAITLVWHQVMEQSVLHFTFDLPSIALACWAFSFLQWIFALMASVPAYSDFKDVSYKVVLDDPKAKIQYNTLLDTCTNHGVVLNILGEANGMAGVVDNGLAYAEEKASSQLKDQVDGYHGKCISHASGQITRAIVRTFLAGALKNAVQLNLQVTVLTIRRAISTTSLSDGPVTGQFWAILVLGVSFLSVMSLISDAVKAVAFSWRIQGQLHERLDSLEEEAKPPIKKLLSSLCSYTLVLAGLVVACVFLVGYAVLKLVMSFECTNAIWNISGCVELEGLPPAVAENRSVAQAHGRVPLPAADTL